ncbi:MAG: hypothetical protein JW999_04775 [Methanotrichaceae archaeon]|nr:hypothetical protein [Methanotrichaceae archaeon]
MKFRMHKAVLFLKVLCLGIMLIGTVASIEDSSSETITYGAYPGAPTSASEQAAKVGAYPSNPVPTYPSNPAPMYPTQPSTVTTTALSTSTSSITAVYSTQAPPATQQKVLLSYNVQTAPPATVYFSGTFMPWTSFRQIFPAKSPMLWVTSSAGWSWYASCPVGGWVQNLMYVPYTGTMKLYEFYPDGSTKLYSYGFATPGYKYIWFYADTPGRHLSLFTIFDKPSNYITIDVF